MTELVHDRVLPYLRHRDPDIRNTTAQVCCTVFSRDTILQQKSRHSLKIVDSTLTALLKVAIADPDPFIREATFSALGTAFDRHLSMATHTRALLVAINDESYSVRELAVRLLGRVSSNVSLCASPTAF